MPFNNRSFPHKADQHLSPLFPLLLLITPLLLSVLLCQSGGVAGSIHGLRIRRQVNVTSGGQVKGNGNQTGMSAGNNMWKKEDGTIGANGSSVGVAQGPGNSNLQSSSNAVVGGLKAEGVGVALTNGTNTQSSGQTSSNINGGQMTVQNLASGTAQGTGDSKVAASGAGSLMNGSQSNSFSGRNNIAEAGATGNQMSYAKSTAGQILNWFSVMDTVNAIATAKGENNSQANIELRAGSKNSGLTVDGLVSGVNDRGGGNTFSEVVGSGTLNNQTASMQAGMMGAVNATSGGSKLVGASSLEQSGTTNNNSMNSFGDIRLNGTGQSMGGLLSNTSVNSDGTLRGVVGAQGMSNGANKSLSVQDGLKSQDGNSSIASIGQGNVEGTGNMASNASSFVVNNYQSGQGSGMIVGSRGQSMSQNSTGSDLRINNSGNFLSGSQITNASSNAIGKVTGQQSSVDGQAIMDLSGTNKVGNSSIVATGGGNGPSSALTNTDLSLAGPGGGAPINAAVKGSVDAQGNQTYVQSISNVSNRNGLSSLFNSQNATVQGSGSSQAQASNVGTLMKRRKRRARAHVDKLVDILNKRMERK